MIVMISGAAALLAGAVAFSLFRHETTNISTETLIRKLRPLTPSGRAALDKVCMGPKPTEGPEVQISKENILNIFWNSRVNVCLANHARLCNLEDKELAAMFTIMQEDHAKLRWQIFLFIIESFIGKLNPAYPRLLLWTYGDELELLSQISEKCGPLEGNAIRAIL